MQRGELRRILHPVATVVGPPHRPKVRATRSNGVSAGLSRMPRFGVAVSISPRVVCTFGGTSVRPFGGLCRVNERSWQ